MYTICKNIFRDFLELLILQTRVDVKVALKLKIMPLGVILRSYAQNTKKLNAFVLSNNFADGVSMDVEYRIGIKIIANFLMCFCEDVNINHILPGIQSVQCVLEGTVQIHYGCNTGTKYTYNLNKMRHLSYRRDILCQ